MRHPHFLWSLYWNLSHWSLTPCENTCKPTPVQMHTHALTLCTLNCIQPELVLKFWRWLVRLGELSEEWVPCHSATGSAGWSCDRETRREANRKTDKKSGHLDRQAAGSHGGVTDRMVLSCSVSVLSASKTYESTLKRLGIEPRELFWFWPVLEKNPFKLFSILTYQ